MQAAPVQSTPETSAEPLTPNDFELEGWDASVHFSTTSITGEPRFDYQDCRRKVNVRGEDIRLVETEVGTLVTVTLEPDADAGELLFSVLIPRARVDGPERKVLIETQGFITRSCLARGPAADAQLQTYVILPLRGWAMSFAF
ncbi:hypothetical protein CYFUS_002622 [Cystobacter fuscus]|uniref:Lipoprotein n=1 Tax=Cystobacter fuscus TaxID=43 RepID=A0A250J1D0_9BACT|nr:hypothetical protein [Cystobacter fuscus]ATB37201.1 hypothetical protein CYFUS_002622 [Cystobacter fuscus]